jgi:alpha-1,3-glucosyltransferase
MSKQARPWDLLIRFPPIALDYPPFFAYFSYLLALPARLVLEKGTANEILQLSRRPVETWATVLYMRMTVLISELVLLFGVLR